MNIHEYQAKALLAKYGIKVPSGGVAFTPTEAEEVAKKLVTDTWVVKAQVHAGGRGKAGGVKLVKDIKQVKAIAESMLGMKLVTHQTGPTGKIVKRIYIEVASNIKKEYYLSIVLDRSSCSIVLLASAEGGIDIEEVAAKSPDKVIKVIIDPLMGLQGFHTRKLGYALGITQDKSKNFTHLVNALYKSFIENDALQIEINPLIETAEGDFVALDAKFNFDSNALFRHPDILVLDDPNEHDPLEVKAATLDLSYVKMDGNIGCMVNGAGLAMATMDIIQLHGGSPANFLDVGGGASEEKVREAFKIIVADPKVKGILINIFGGIMRCDIIAHGVINAVKQVAIHVPVVVRLEGTNVELGKELLEKSGLSIQAADSLVDAAKKIVQAIK